MTASLRCRLLMIHNPTAGRRRRRYLAAVLDALACEGCTTTVMATERRGDAERMAREAERVDAVVVAGGDGTVAEAANGLVGSAVPLAVVPLGTANVLAHEIGLPMAPASLARAIARGPCRSVHAGEANGRRFMMMAGAGFDAGVVEQVKPGVKRWLGKGAYVLASVTRVLAYREERFRLDLDGSEHEAASVIVAKGHFYAGRFVVAPMASLDEPIFQVALFEHPGRLPAMAAMAAMAAGRLDCLPGFRILAARSVMIEGDAGAPIQADGDIVARVPARLAIAREPVRLVVAA
ncbi:MAG: YegS/Rv2252/BmrU family lipid kinase [Proteobacteria bacterium]|nr:YegS/Rv2252/BmrU family lipid kinase [Pseudomonadota bacterium]MBI3496845.1 YegS/Rv2252/BmrU family lipid kinase [Pseudomonadota bacterium]